MYDEARGYADVGSNVPATVVGTFQSSFASFGQMAGGFGAHRQQAATERSIRGE